MTTTFNGYEIDERDFESFKRMVDSIDEVKMDKGARQCIRELAIARKLTGVEECSLLIGTLSGAHQKYGDEEHTVRVLIDDLVEALKTKKDLRTIVSRDREENYDFWWAHDEEARLAKDEDLVMTFRDVYGWCPAYKGGPNWLERSE